MLGLFRAFLFSAALVSAGLAHAADLTVMISGGFSSSFEELVPEFEKATGHKVTTLRGPSMGTTANAIPVRLARGEPADVLIMVGYALDKLIEDGKAQAGSKVDLARSPIGMAVRAGEPAPDIGTLDGFKRVLLEAKSVAYSDSASGVYIEKEMFKKLGIEEQMKGKARMIPATPVGEVVAKGEAQIGFQQVAELKPVHGITLVGLIPAEVQQITIFSAGLASGSKQPDAARQLIAFLTSAEAQPVLAKKGLLPARE